MQFLFTPQIIVAALVGALIELDNYFVGMTLIAQPVIVGGITGLIFNDIQTGILLGSIVQLIWISPPVGAYVPPSSSAIAFIATAMAIMMRTFELKNNDQALLMFGLCGGAAAGYFIGQADIWNRKLNTKIVHFFEAGILSGKSNCIIVVQIASITAKYIRDFVVYILFLGLGIGLSAKIYNSLPVEVIEGLSRALWLMPAVGLAVIYETFRSKLGSLLHIVIFIIAYLLLIFNKGINGWFMLLAVITVCLVVVYNFVWNKKGV